MKLFTKQKNSNDTPKKERKMSKEEINAFLGASTEYTGRLIFQGAVRIDGIFHGEISSEGSLIIGKDAQVEGTINVGELVISGMLHGKVYAKKKVTIHRGGKIVGNVYTPSLAVEEGAVLQGTIDMENEPHISMLTENAGHEQHIEHHTEQHA